MRHRFEFLFVAVAVMSVSADASGRATSASTDNLSRLAAVSEIDAHLPANRSLPCEAQIAEKARNH